MDGHQGKYRGNFQRAERPEARVLSLPVWRVLLVQTPNIILTLNYILDYMSRNTPELRDVIFRNMAASAMEMRDALFRDPYDPRVDLDLPDNDRNAITTDEGGLENGDARAFIDAVLAIDDEAKSRAFSRIVDEGLHEVLEHGVYVQRQALDETTLLQLETRQVLKHEIYESTPTDVLIETIGGNSLAILQIDKGNPEVTSKAHTHNGSRAVTPLSKAAILVMPDRVIQLKRGDVVWMDPWTQHSFQEGTFLAYHSSEAGWQHEHAFNPLPEAQD